MIELHHATADTESHWIFFLISDLALTWWKMIDLLPGTADHKLT